MTKKTIAILIAVLAAAVGLGGASTAGASELRYCNNSPIIQCGTLTASEFTEKYNENAKGDLPAIYSHYGINPKAIAGAKDGTINKNGEIEVDGQVVATGAWSVGRQKLGTTNREVSISGKTYYEKPASAALTVQEEPAFVFLDKNGQYTGAIIKSCANPVKATPVPPKTPEKPKPEKPQPQPDAECKSLSARISNRTDYRLTARAGVSNGATINAHHYVITNDETGETVLEKTVDTDSTQSSIEGTLPAGSYTAEVTIETSVGDKTGENCTKPLKIKQDNCPIPGKEHLPADSDECVETPVEPEPPVEPEVPEELPKTGAAEQIMNFLGFGATAASGSYYYASRRGILKAWLNR